MLTELNQLGRWRSALDCSAIWGEEGDAYLHMKQAVTGDLKFSEERKTTTNW